jgi:hypothetical protein
VTLGASGCLPDDSSSSSPSSTCDQNCKDFNASLAITSAVSFLYDQNVAGKNTGVQVFDVACPTGGRVKITGATALDTTNGISTVHLAFDMAACRSVGSNYDLTMTGKLANDGTFSRTSTALTYSGSGLSLAGQAGGGVATLSGACDVAITRATDTQSGSLCGRPFSGRTPAR